MKTLTDLINKANEQVPKILCSELADNMDSFTLIDVREPTEIEETGSIVGATNVPRGLVEMKLSPSDQTMNENTPIVVFCGGGSRAALAGNTLMELGFKNIYNLEKAQKIYDAVRSKRTKKIQRLSMMQGKIYHMKNPILVAARNAVMKYTSIPGNDLKKIHNYDAHDEINIYLLIERRGYNDPMPPY